MAYHLIKNKIRTNSIGDMPLYGISPNKNKIRTNSNDTRGNLSC